MVAILTAPKVPGANLESIGLLLTHEDRAIDAITGERRGTALLFAVQERHADAMDKLLAAGANPNHVNTRGCMDARIAAALLAAGARTEDEDEDGDTALLLSVQSGYQEKLPVPRPKLTKALIDGGADPNHPDAAGGTALHWSVYHDDLEAVAALVAAGANQDLPATPCPFRGLAAWDLAMEMGRAHIMRLLDPDLPPSVAAGDEAAYYAALAADGAEHYSDREL